MDSISLVTINGSMYFVKSIKPCDVSDKVDAIAQKISVCANTKKESDIFSQFTQEVSQQLNIELSRIEISHVYRINTWDIPTYTN